MKMKKSSRLCAVIALALPLAVAAGGQPANAQSRGSADIVNSPVADISYADLADLTQAADIIARVKIRDQATLPPERAPGVAAGHVRLYIEAETEALLKSPASIGESLVYLVDVPLGSNGKPPKLKKSSVLVFADPVPGRPGELQLVAPDAQFASETNLEARTRALIAEMASPDAPPVVTGVRDVISVEGNLVGESETQLFVETATGAPVSMTVIRRPGMAPQWGISWSEIVDQSARAPQRGTLEWYRLACSLPQSLPDDSFLQGEQDARRRAREDYAWVLGQLGPCGRTRFDS